MEKLSGHQQWGEASLGDVAHANGQFRRMGRSQQGIIPGQPIVDKTDFLARPKRKIRGPAKPDFKHMAGQPALAGDLDLPDLIF